MGGASHRIFLAAAALAVWYPIICSSRKIELGMEQVVNLEEHQNASSSSLLPDFDPSKSMQLSWHPRVSLYEGFLSDEECDHLISMALGKNLNANNDTEKSALQSTNSSTGIFLAAWKDSIVSKIEERIALWTFLPKENGEDIQILHYGVNESYGAHFDYYDEKSDLLVGGNRIATVLMYLSNVGRGGETFFPKSSFKGTQRKEARLSECARTGYAVKPVKGDALLIFNLNPDATTDETSLHGGCSIHDGEKWFARKYIHVRSFNTRNPRSSLTYEDECIDEEDNCAGWASNGECQRNPIFMVGTPDYYGSCRKSCNAC